MGPVVSTSPDATTETVTDASDKTTWTVQTLLFQGLCYLLLQSAETCFVFMRLNSLHPNLPADRAALQLLLAGVATVSWGPVNLALPFLPSHLLGLSVSLTIYPYARSVYLGLLTLYQLWMLLELVILLRRYPRMKDDRRGRRPPIIRGIAQIVIR